MLVESVQPPASPNAMILLEVAASSLDYHISNPIELTFWEFQSLSKLNDFLLSLKEFFHEPAIDRLQLQEFSLISTSFFARRRAIHIYGLRSGNFTLGDSSGYYCT